MIPRLLLLGVTAMFATAAQLKAEQKKTGKIEGTVFPLPQVNLLPPVEVEAIELYTPSDRNPIATAPVDADGKFSFDAVPTGIARIKPVFRVGGINQPVALSTLVFQALVYEGKTTDVGIFGRGRPLVGKVMSSAGRKPQGMRIQLGLQAPPFRAMRGDGLNPVREVHNRVRKDLGRTVNADGTFRIEGVREGTYTVVLWEANKPSVVKQIERRYPLIENGKLTVDLIAGGQSEKPLDVGTLQVD